MPSPIYALATIVTTKINIPVRKCRLISERPSPFYDFNVGKDKAGGGEMELRNSSLI